jgi:hypothetical protein
LYGSVKLSAWILPFEVERAIRVAAYLLGCEAVYRAPFDNLYSNRRREIERRP